MSLTEIDVVLERLADPTRAKGMSRFFKTGEGEYGEGDIFMGIPVPELRKLGKDNQEMPLGDLERLLGSEKHEKRSLALIVLRLRYEKAGRKEQESLCRFYLRNLDAVDNWDLCDMSAPYLLGAENLKDNFRKAREALTESPKLFERRVALVSTLKETKAGKTGPALKISKQLLGDPEDLIHKACGWMLREVYKQDPEALREFLSRNAAKMPRVTLRYAIERMDKEERLAYLEQ